MNRAKSLNARIGQRFPKNRFRQRNSGGQNYSKYESDYNNKYDDNYNSFEEDNDYSLSRYANEDDYNYAGRYGNVYDEDDYYTGDYGDENGEYDYYGRRRQRGLASINRNEQRAIARRSDYSSREGRNYHNNGQVNYPRSENGNFRRRFKPLSAEEQRRIARMGERAANKYEPEQKWHGDGSHTSRHRSGKPRSRRNYSEPNRDFESMNRGREYEIPSIGRRTSYNGTRSQKNNGSNRTKGPHKRNRKGQGFASTSRRQFHEMDEMRGRTSHGGNGFREGNGSREGNRNRRGFVSMNHRRAHQMSGMEGRSSYGSRRGNGSRRG